MRRHRILDTPLVLVGPGRAGMALARSWKTAGGRLAGVLGKTPASTRRAARRLGAPALSRDELPRQCEILVIAVPDDRIAPVAKALGARTKCRYAFHLSGALPASILAPLRRGGASIGSVHPLRAFAGDARANWEGALVAVEGEPEAVRAGERLARALGADGYRIATKAKPLYHAAATLAAGGTAALLSIAVRAAIDAGVPGPRARAALGRLAAEAASATAAKPFADAFTGPIARRDAETVRAHRAAAGGRRDFFELYRRLAREILATTPGRGREKEIHAILGGSKPAPSRPPSRTSPRRGPRRRPDATISRVFTRPKGA